MLLRSQQLFQPSLVALQHRTFARAALVKDIPVISEVQTQFLINNARLKINLPSKENTWFFVTKDTTVTEFKANIEAEDSAIESVQLQLRNANSQDKLLPLSGNDKLWEHLKRVETELMLTLNENIYEIATSKPLEYVPEFDPKWANYSTQKGLPHLHANTVNTIVTQVIKNQDFSQGTISADRLKTDFVEELDFFNDPVIREEIYRLQSLKMITETELEKLQHRLSEIRDKENIKKKVYFTALSSFFTVQFILSYYGIFHVEWLGWDLVEPWTYTVTQGTFIMSLFYISKNRNYNAEYTSLDDRMEAALSARMMKKYNFDLPRYIFLKKKVSKIESELQQALVQRIR